MRKCSCLICGRDIYPVNVEDPSVCVRCLRCLAPKCASNRISPDYAKDGTPTVVCAECRTTWSVAEYERDLAACYNMVPCPHCSGSGYMAQPGAPRQTFSRVPEPVEPTHEPEPVIVDIEPGIDEDDVEDPPMEVSAVPPDPVKC